MNPRHVFRSRFVLVAVLAALIAVLGCSCSKSTKPKVFTEKPIPHTDADDIVQIVATTVSADNGGWYFLVKAYCDTLSHPAPNFVARPSGRSLPMPLSSVRPSLRTNYSLTKGGMTYNMQVGWSVGDTLLAERDTSVSEMVALVGMDNGVFTNANGIVNGSYGCHTYTPTANDSFFVISNVGATDPDTLEFAGSLLDTCYANVQSTINTGGSSRLWYLGGDGANIPNLVSYTLRILKSSLASSPYPIADQSEVTWVIEAKGLNSAARTDWGFDDLVEARMTFDGTSVAKLGIGNAYPNPDWEYTYTVDLNTGAIHRTN